MVRWQTPLLAPLALLAMAARNPETPAPRPQAPGWTQRHQDKLAEIRQGPVDLIFLGDSITQELESTNVAWGNLNTVWQRFYGCRHAVNLGFNGDSTANLLWRLQNGEIDGIRPKLAVIMVGSNNIRPAIASTADETARAIALVVAEVHRRLPSTRILLLGIPPSGRMAATEQERAEVNAALAQQNWTANNATFLNIDSALQKDGKIDLSLYRQGAAGRGAVHPNATGWQKLAQTIEPTVGQLMGDKGCR